MRQQQEGYTLVELIVSFAILMIVGVAMFGFLSFCINQSKKTEDEISLQLEAQLCQGRLEQQILSATDAVKATGDSLSLFRTEDGKEYKTDFHLVNHKLMYQDYRKESGEWKPLDAEGNVTDQEDPECFASYVESFSVELYDKEGKKITAEQKDVQITKVEVNLSMRAGGQTYAATDTIALRNRIYK